MSIKLSFCIPTYNRGAYLGRLIESIASQWTDEVEIVISDNASTDNTEEIIADYQKKYPRIVYSKSETNLGPDRNYLRAVELAQGEYCWLFGSDDYLAEGAIARMLGEIQDNRDIYLTARQEEKGKRDWLDYGDDKVCNLCDKVELLDYLNHAQSVGALFSYLSSIVIRRAAWTSAVVNEDYIGTAYVHVQVIMEMIKNGSGQIKYISQAFPIVGDGGDTFMADGYARRVLIDLDGYYKLAEDYYATDEEIKSAFLHVMYREHDFGFWKFLRWGGCMSPKEMKNVYETLVRNYGVSQTVLRFTSILSPLARVFVSIKRNLKKM